MSAAIVWFRRDLRLTDQPALEAALSTGLPIVALYIHAPKEEAPWAPGAATHWWLHQSLTALDVELRARGGRLIVRRGASSLKVLREVIAETGATQVFWNRLYEPAVIARDTRIKQALQGDGLTVDSFNGSLLFEPWQLATGAGDPYRVFTPFWRNARARLSPGQPARPPKRIAGVAKVRSDAIDDLRLMPRIIWYTGMAESWTPGERGAEAELDVFIDGAIGTYKEQRDRPDRRATSRLSPHLHFGEISPRQIVAVLQAKGLVDVGEHFIRELGWREFNHHLLFHFPATTDQPLNPQFARFPWAVADDAVLEAWRRGRTGIPLVDAGMRELWHTGWMHNRVRMVVASYLTKNLRQHWLHGARWFWDTLVDADLANNTAGWQWTAGSGADAAPYFRIFNPVSQGERFDPKGEYVRRWIPELARVPLPAVQQPWTLGPLEAKAAGIAGSVYAAPQVDLKQSREAALAAYQHMRAG